MSTSLASEIDQARWAMVAGRDIPWLLRRQAERRADHRFLVWEPFEGEGATWTYAEFRADVRRLAGALAARGVGPGDKLLVHLDNSPAFLLSWFASAELGAVAVSTNTRSVARDLTYFAEHTSAVGAITSPGFADLVADACPDLGFLVVTADDAGAPAGPFTASHESFDDLLAEGGEVSDRPVDASHDLGIQFTSGTTSRPKAVLWTHANAIWGAQVNVAHMRLRSEDVTLAFLPMFHTNAQSYSMLSTLWSGGTLVLQPRFSASRFWEVSVRHGVTWTSLVPFCIKAIAAQPTPPEHHYRFWGSAVEMPELADLLGIHTFGWWGMTETITQGIVSDPDQIGPRMGIGRPSPAYEIAVRRPDGTPVDPGERGALFIRGVRGVSLFKEYYRNPDATAEAFDEHGWFTTGDVVVVDPEGNLFFGDREKDMLKVGGENVAASEVEAVLMESGLIAEAAVVAQSHPMLDEVPAAFVIPGPGAPDDLAERLAEWCRRDLADFKVPRTIVVVDDLPRGTLEKVAKNELRSRLAPLDA